MSPSFYRFKSPEHLRKFIESASSQVSESVSGSTDSDTVADPWAELFRGTSSGESEPTQPTPSSSKKEKNKVWEPDGECRKSAESASKPRLELVPYQAISDIAEVLTFGANKYDANNWCRGARWGRYFAALCRHIFAWWRGEDKDQETGLSHLAHAGCCLLFLMEYQRNGWGQDDRFRNPDTQPFLKNDSSV